MDNNYQVISSKNLDHLGIIAGIIDDLGIVEKIDKIVGNDVREKISAGQVVKAIILNGLGFVSQPLYLFEKFFENKAIGHLLGEDINTSHLNDDKIGRVMDELYKNSLSTIFTVIALDAAEKYKVDKKYSHLDSSSFHLHGKYNQSEENSYYNQINITYGYSRDHRPDLKQFLIDIVCSSDGDVPLYSRIASGNEQDRAVFAQILQEYKKQINFESIMVCDSALYSQRNLHLLEGIKWLSRVPFTVKKAKDLANSIKSSDLIKSKQKGYNFKEININHNAVEQRWLIVESEARKKADIDKLVNKIDKELDKVKRKLATFGRSKIASLKFAKVLVKQLSKQLKYHEIEKIKYKKSSNKLGKIVYSIEANIKEKQSFISAEKNRAGRFILATNVLDKQKLSTEEILSGSKKQQSAERGFRFLKDPLFFADSIFLKNPQRIETMAMLMGLCLLVYTIGQRVLRCNLQISNAKLKNQLGKLTDRPTLRWIFQCFQGIHILIINGLKLVNNLTQDLIDILQYLPTPCQKYYFFSSG